MALYLLCRLFGPKQQCSDEGGTLMYRSSSIIGAIRLALVSSDSDRAKVVVIERLVAEDFCPPLDGADTESVEALVAAIKGAAEAVVPVLRDLIAERDRLCEALQRIASGDVPGVTFADDDLISAFAREALDA